MVTEQLVENILNTAYEDIPDRVKEHAKKSMLNWLGVTIGAIEHESIDILVSLADELESASQNTILGRNQKVDLLSAVLINGTASHIFDFDDTHLDTIHHPSGPVGPVVFALGEKYDLSPKELIRAFVLGCEVELRISNAVYPSHYRQGYHITATAGVFGAAAAAGILLGFNEEKMAMALGLAGTQAFGLRETFGTMTKPLHPGKAAQNGLLASLLVNRGFTSSTQILDAKRGFLNVYSQSSQKEKVNDSWGQVWEIEKNAFKPYACGIVLHPSIDACIQLSEFAAPDEVKEIRLKVHPYVLELTGKETPGTSLEGKFSIYHTAAIAFLEKDASENQYQENKVNNNETVTFRKKIKPYVTEEMNKDKVEATLTKHNGETIRVFIEHATGSLENPMTEKMLVRKFRKVCQKKLSASQINQVVDQLLNLERIDSINQTLHVINEDNHVK
ncbi:MmgE/PrpD family protein [Alteribacillus sp. JSM 102045]|uniref:MmgE/PrpD family protein n=1 Tax=Alteribacillus sp. JSM 102045 TaxID=1562101 RepID=UPI0035C08CBE